MLYPEPTQFQIVRADELENILQRGDEEPDTLRRRLLARMHDISSFMKTLKQRFSVWFNRSHNRVITLWSEQFRSTLEEENYTALGIVSAYIDLNPVHAGTAEAPKDYRWSGYGEATGGSAKARAGIISAIAEPDSKKTWRSETRTYRLILYCQGASPAPGKGGPAGMI